MFLAAFLTTLLTSLAFPVLAQLTPAQSTPTTVTPTTLEEQNGWQTIENNMIKILFPRDGRKPMFLWWYKNEPDKIYVVKYQGLTEFLTFDVPYYMRRHIASGETIREKLLEGFIGLEKYKKLEAWIRYRLMALHIFYGLHSPILDFQRCNWTLSGPESITKGAKSYLSFNFTLTEAPLGFDFAEGNIIIRCRFYYTDATESVDNLYNYTVKAGELKMDFVVNHWEWNIDKIRPLLTAINTALKEYNITIPEGRAGLASWINLASVDLSKLANATNDPEQIEGISTTTDMIVEDRRINVRPNKILTGEYESPINVSKGPHEHFKLRFARQDRTLAGFFKFVASAKVTNSTGYSELWPVKASYIEAGNHMELFLCYPYFGNRTLEHDPSLGIEVMLPLVSPELVAVLLGTVSVIAVIVFAAKWKRRVVNIVGVK